MKDPRERVRDLADIALLLREIGADRGGAVAPMAPRASSRPWPLIAAIGVIGVLLGVFAGVRWFARPAANGKGAASGARVASTTQLTDLPEVQYEPNLSPDGKSLLYVAADGGDEDIFLQRVGGENAVNLTGAFADNDFDPAFSPDGERIAFGSRREGGGVFVMGATGESPKKIATEGAHPSWSPDGSKIVYSTERVTDPFSRNTVASLWVVEVATGEKKRIYEGDAAQPVWSPSGRRIAFWSADQGQRDVRTIPAEGGAFVAVTHDVAADWDPFWSPDGSWLYFLSDRRGGPDLWRVPIDESSGVTRGAPEPVTTGTSRPMQGSISADGHRIALTIDTSRGEILRAPFDPVEGRVTGAPVSLFSSSSPFTQFDLSDDGTWITYRTTKPRENLFVIKSDGTGRRRLTDDGFRNRGPAWLKGTEWVIFYSNRSGEYQLWLMRRDGTGLRQLANKRDVGINVPSVTRGGDRIAMMLFPTTGLPQLAVANVEADWFGGGAPSINAEIEAAAGAFFPFAWSPDGKRIAGQELTPQGEVPAVFALATDHLEAQVDRGGRDFGSWLPAAVWLPDGRRLLAWDPRRNVAILWDTVAREVRDVPGLPGPSSLELSADGRTLVINRETVDGDIWMLTLE